MSSVWKKIKYIGSDIYARYYNASLNAQITIQDTYRGHKFEVLVYMLPIIKPKINRKFDTKEEALIYARKIMREMVKK